MILITGYRGNIGSKLTKKLSDFVGIDTKEGKNLLTCELPENIDVIYHLAAHAPVEWSWQDPMRTMENLTSTIRLTHHYPNAKIIFASTGAAIDPITPYGFSKWVASEYLKRFHKNAVILYLPNIFGIPRSVVDIFKGRDEITIYGDGLQTRDYVHVDDIVAGLVKAKDWEAGEYFMGSGIETNLLQLAKGKTVTFKPVRKEAKESVLPNTTPNQCWKPIINVLDYICENI